MTKKLHLTLRRLCLGSALALPMLAFAGNIPQYAVTKGGTPYTDMAGGTALSAMVFTNGNGVLFADGKMFYGSEKTAPGFPIGFSFRLGGQLFDQFAITNNGDLYLGNGTVGYGTTGFRLGMSTITCGLYRADVSYATEGEEGDRVLTVQYRNAVLNETTKDKGKFNLQLRLHEADGRIEMALQETETCYGLGGFVTGLRGWDDDDTILLTAAGLDKPFSISPWKTAGILDGDSYINWDCDDYDRDYAPVFTFTPAANTAAPAGAPQDLTVTQDEDRVVISCRRAADAQATAVLISESPFTEVDLPVDGVTFRAGMDANGKWHTRLGSSTAVYYGDAEEMTLTVPGLEAGRTYHICAISANGYPAYNRDGRAECVLSSAQAAPESLAALPGSADRVRLSCAAAYPVIIAATTEGNPAYGAGYAGVFGTPSADAQVGDLLPGGGSVVYAGEPGGEIDVTVSPNRLTYFRAWTVDGDRVSSTFTDAVGLPTVSFPYAPGVEDYPLAEGLWGWSHSDADEFVPVDRAYAHDRALLATSIDNTELSLTTPAFTSHREMTLSLGFAMETEKEASAGEEGQLLMQGYEPGHFDGTGYFRILSGGTLLREITEYGGTMRGVATGGNEDGSSTFETVEVVVPATGEPQTLTFSFATPKKSRLFLRDIRIEQTGEAPALPERAPYNLTLAYVNEEHVAYITAKADRAGDAHGTLLLLSVGDFDGEPEEGRTYGAGDAIGNATVLYHGTDRHIEVTSQPVECEQEYVVTGLSHNAEGSYGPERATARLIPVGVTAPTEDSATTAIYNVAGVRLKAEKLGELPAGLYIVNGRKVIVK